MNEAQAKIYASFLASRYKRNSNIIWLNGGDIKGDSGFKIWKVIGNTIHSFHHEPWLDFNMFQSGHKSYAQDTSSKERYITGRTIGDMPLTIII